MASEQRHRCEECGGELTCCGPMTEDGPLLDCLLCQQSEIITKLKAQLAAMDQQAGNVLARIHGDGGHYITQHGWEKACVDADAVVCRLQAQLAASEKKVEALLPHGNRRRVELLNERLSLGSLSEAHQKELDSLQSLFGEIHGKRLAAGNDALRNALEAP